MNGRWIFAGLVVIAVAAVVVTLLITHQHHTCYTQPTFGGSVRTCH